jgi:hypothetical protein
VREAQNSLQKADYSIPIDHPKLGTLDLYRQAIEVASKFWRHSSDYIKESIGELERCSTAAVPAAMLGPLHTLVLAFDGLSTLQQEMNQAEKDYEVPASEKPGTRIYWGSPVLGNAMASFIQSLASLAEVAEKSNEWGLRNRRVVREQLAILNKAWDNLYPQLTLAFDEILPEVRTVVYERWRKFDQITGLPASAAFFDMDKSLEVTERPRVFFPRMLLLRFLNVAMTNLKTAAFCEWAPEALAQAWARIEIMAATESGEHFIRLRIVDNGGLHRLTGHPGQIDGGGQQRGLKDVKKMAETFGGRLVGPLLESGETVVELQMRHLQRSNETYV